MDTAVQPHSHSFCLSAQPSVHDHFGRSVNWEVFACLCPSISAVLVPTALGLLTNPLWFLLILQNVEKQKRYFVTYFYSFAYSALPQTHRLRISSAGSLVMDCGRKYVENCELCSLLAISQTPIICVIYTKKTASES